MSQGGMNFSPEECSLYELARSSLYTAQDVAEKKVSPHRVKFFAQGAIIENKPSFRLIILLLAAD